MWRYDKRFDDAGSHDPLQVPAGFIPQNTSIEYRVLPDQRVMMSVIGKIWKNYSGRLLDIFKRDNFKKSVSVEKVVDEIEEKDEIEEFLYTRFNKKIKLVNPKKDKKKDIIQIALSNCAELLRIENSKTQTTIYEEVTCPCPFVG